MPYLLFRPFEAFIFHSLLFLHCRLNIGYDCGVFTCMFADFLSKDTPLLFTQEHINQCRERIALSIMNGKAIM